jgi:mannan endo-1,4-beta-mannosidase
MMYERFVNVHHLNNLIWVWDTNTPRRLFQDEAYAYDEFFPGLDCVDVLAADVYHNDFKQSHHDELLELGKGKPIALGEVGEVPTPTILKMQPFWTWFMIWGNFVDTHNTPVQVRRLYSDPREGPKGRSCVLMWESRYRCGIGGIGHAVVIPRS